MRADSLMRIIPRETVIVASTFDYFDETLREALRAHAERLHADALWMVRRGVPVRVLDDSKVFMKRTSIMLDEAVGRDREAVRARVMHVARLDHAHG